MKRKKRLKLSSFTSKSNGKSSKKIVIKNKRPRKKKRKNPEYSKASFFHQPDSPSLRIIYMGKRKITKH